MTSNFICLLVLIASLNFATRISSRTVESGDLMNSIQSPVMMTHSYPNMIKTMQEKIDEGGERFCQIEYQVTRKRSGKCMQISNGITGCISGEYIDPFHPDCF
ncbi:uncharacterized protein LOC114871168 isoform X1 [Osmia bicornis bicornis]|uniref:uncharacterized protein LOC114871168 isoform X1 n=2 Tax=Osmia bicornis bicornis TaxID=1437191 RepID=UPI0010F78537|nr:uncharacterized protein LOC114871168 isoform X1 [Osmia bicornis bicornis]XP_029032580.1 uncharacterized protein LOC114871168 isoform X1 [Osmia bicornis bicornis]